MSSLQKDLNYNQQQDQDYNKNNNDDYSQQQYQEQEQEHEENFSSQVYPKQAGDLKRGDVICFTKSKSEVRPCKILEIETFKNGKHGSAKCSIVAEDFFIGGRKYELVAPASFTMMCPFVTKNEYQLIDVVGNQCDNKNNNNNNNNVTLSLLDEKTFEQRQDLDLPMKENENLSRMILSHFEAGKELILISQCAMNIEQIVAFKMMANL